MEFNGTRDEGTHDGFMRVRYEESLKRMRDDIERHS